MAEPMYFLTAATMFKIVILLSLVPTLPYYFTVVPMWPKSHHNTGPQVTFLRHLVDH